MKKTRQPLTNPKSKNLGKAYLLVSQVSLTNPKLESRRRQIEESLNDLLGDMLPKVNADGSLTSLEPES